MIESLAVDRPWLMMGDCLERMAEIPDGSVDLVVADPPYTMTKKGKSVRPNYMPVSMGDNFFPGVLPDKEKWLSECYRAMDPESSHLYVFCNTNDIHAYLNAAALVGFKLHNIISMIKDTKMPNRWYLKYTELILFFRKGKAKPINDMTSRDWVKVSMPTQANGKLHITQKPLELVQKFVTNSSQPDDCVLDPFFGSGTTGVACAETGRTFIGIEQDPDCFNIGRRRIEAAIAATQPAPPGGLFDVQEAAE